MYSDWHLLGAPNRWQSWAHHNAANMTPQLTTFTVVATSVHNCGLGARGRELVSWLWPSWWKGNFVKKSFRYHELLSTVPNTLQALNTCFKGRSWEPCPLTAVRLSILMYDWLPNTLDIRYDYHWSKSKFIIWLRALIQISKKQSCGPLGFSLCKELSHPSFTSPLKGR